MNQKLEDELKTVQIENDKLKIEKATLQQRIKVLEYDIKKARGSEETRVPDSGFAILQRELEELKVTNSVYLEKINELVDQLNRMDEEHYMLTEEKNKQLLILKKQNDELLARLPEHERIMLAKNIGPISTEVAQKRKITNPISIGKYGGDDMERELRSENETLKQQLLLLKNKNMELLNIISEYKHRLRKKDERR